MKIGFNPGSIVDASGAPYPIDGREARKSVDLIERIYRDAATAG